MPDNAEFIANPLDFMKQYPLHPVTGPQKVTDKGNYHSVNKSDRVAFMDIKQGLPPDVQGLQELGLPNNDLSQSHIATCYEADNPDSSRIPVFWLPYRHQSTFRITLLPPEKQPLPNFFLTAALDGCSIYVEGPPDKPTVYHINAINTKYRGPDNVEHGLTGNYANDTLVFQAKTNHMTMEFQGTPPP